MQKKKLSEHATNTGRESGYQNTTSRHISHSDKPQAKQMNFTQDGIEALHRRIFSGQMVISETRAYAGATQTDAAVTDDTGHPFWGRKKR